MSIEQQRVWRKRIRIPVKALEELRSIPDPWNHTATPKELEAIGKVLYYRPIEESDVLALWGLANKRDLEATKAWIAKFLTRRNFVMNLSGKWVQSIGI